METFKANDFSVRIAGVNSVQAHTSAVEYKEGV